MAAGEQAAPGTRGDILHLAPRKAPAAMLQEGSSNSSSGGLERATREENPEAHCMGAFALARGKEIHPAEPCRGPIQAEQGVISDQI